MQRHTKKKVDVNRQIRANKELLIQPDLVNVIDPLLTDFFKASLNIDRFATIFSCQGHFDKDPEDRKGYVMFLTHDPTLTFNLYFDMQQLIVQRQEYAPLRYHRHRFEMGFGAQSYDLMKWNTIINLRWQFESERLNALFCKLLTDATKRFADRNIRL